jgi:23S rRNA (adenine2030-N6)-methyltransferase
MLSYQHGYHAGNLADMHKHRTLAQVLSAMVQAHPDQPISYFETHAGRGVYDLSDAQASKTGEAKEAVLAMNLSQCAEDDVYAQAIRATQARFGKSWYPGSPHIARHILRPQDMLHCFELHPQEFAALSMRLKAKNVRLYHKDGYKGVMGLVPPRSSEAGLVLIDPSFEVKSEYAQVAEFIPKLLEKWPQAMILLWYPILDAGLHQAMIASLMKVDLPQVWYHEEIFPQESVLRMKGSGVFAVNMTKLL